MVQDRQQGSGGGGWRPAPGSPQRINTWQGYRSGFLLPGGPFGVREGWDSFHNLFVRGCHCHSQSIVCTRLPSRVHSVPCSMGFDQCIVSYTIIVSSENALKILSPPPSHSSLPPNPQATADFLTVSFVFSGRSYSWTHTHRYGFFGLASLPV